jgi:hypothetical protein
VAVPSAIFLAVRYALYVRIGGSRAPRRAMLGAELAILLAIPLTSAVLAPAWVLALIGAGAAGLVALKTWQYRPVSASEGAATPLVSVHPQDVRHEDRAMPEGREGRAPSPAEGEARSPG